MKDFTIVADGERGAPILTEGRAANLLGCTGQAEGVPENEDAEVVLGPVEGRRIGGVEWRRGHRCWPPKCSGVVPGIEMELIQWLWILWVPVQSCANRSRSEPNSHQEVGGLKRPKRDVK